MGGRPSGAEKVNNNNQKRLGLSKDRLAMPPPPPNPLRAKEMKMRKNRVSFIFPSSPLPPCTSVIHKRDYEVVLSLHEAYGLFKHMKVIKSPKASISNLLKFHSEDYLEFLKTLEAHGDRAVDDDLLDDYGLEDDVDEVIYP